MSNWKKISNRSHCLFSRSRIHPLPDHAVRQGNGAGQSSGSVRGGGWTAAWRQPAHGLRSACEGAGRWVSSPGWFGVWLVLVFYSPPLFFLHFNIWKLQTQSALTDTVSFALKFSKCACMKCRAPFRPAFWESTGSLPTATGRNWSSVSHFLRCAALSQSCSPSLSTLNDDNELKAQCVRFGAVEWQYNISKEIDIYGCIVGYGQCPSTNCISALQKSSCTHHANIFPRKIWPDEGPSSCLIT